MAKVPNIDPIRVLIADDERLVREILSQELGNDPLIEVVGVAKNGAETIAMIASHKPQVIVLDLEMPTCDGYSVQSFIRQHFSHVYTIIHTAHDDAERVINSLHNGADGYLVKGATISEILTTIHAVHSGHAYFSKEIFRTFRLFQKPIENLENSWAEVPFYEEDKPIRTPSNVEVVPEQKEPKNNTFLKASRSYSNGQLDFEGAILLRQRPTYSRMIALAICGVFTFGIAWAASAKIEDSVRATGTIEPPTKVRDLEIPNLGVVEKIYVKEGDRVAAGTTLLKLESTVTEAEQRSLEATLQQLTRENQLYSNLLKDNWQYEPNIPEELKDIAKQRLQLVGDSHLILGQLGLSTDIDFDKLDEIRKGKLAAQTSKIESLKREASLEVRRLETNLQQTLHRRQSVAQRLEIAQQSLKAIENSTNKMISAAQEVRRIEIEKLTSLQPLVGEGAIAQTVYASQQQKVGEQERQLAQLRIESEQRRNTQQSEINQLETEIATLSEEKKNIEFQVEQARSRVQNVAASIEADLFDKLVEHHQAIAQIDDTITKQINENRMRLNEINHRLAIVARATRHERVTSPVNGTVAQINVSPGSIARPEGTTNGENPLVRITPDEYPVAELLVSANDIGFVKEGTSVDIRLDTFPFSRFGDVKGTVFQVGLNPHLPNEQIPYSHFPVTVSLEKDTILVRGKEKQIQKGWSVTANIKVGQKRSVLNLLFSSMLESLDSFQNLR